MLSTLLNYRLYSNDLTKSLARISQQASVQRESDYYKANIGKVKSTDDLLKNYRLYAYAMKAYGLEDQTQSVGLMRKVLESDLSDSTSFANKLVDKRYREFAAAFQFGSSTEAAIQTTAQTELLTEAYSEHRLRAAAVVAKTVDAYTAKIANVRTVSDLLDDADMFRVVAKVAGRDPDTTDKASLKALLADALTTGAASSGDAQLQELKDRFQFQADGTLPTTDPATTAQTEAARIDISATYYDEMGSGTSSQAAALKTSYVKSFLEANPTAEALAADDQVLDYILTAFGLSPGSETSAFVQNILTSRSDNQPNALSQMAQSTTGEIARKKSMTAINAAFSFNSDGTIDGSLFASGSSFSTLESAFFSNYQKADATRDKLSISTFAVRLSNMKSINDLIGRDAVFGKAAFNYILTAFDIDPTTESTSKIRQVLLSDPSDPTSYVSKLKDERYERLAAAFNFGSDGKASTQRLAQSVTNQTATGTLYTASFGTDISDAKKSLIAKDTEDYLTAVGQIRSLDDFIADKDVVAYALKAYGLEDEKISNADLRKLFTSDLSDPKSFANAKNDKRFTKLVAAFNFTTSGTIQRETEGVQSGSALLSTQNKYLLQTMETQTGESSEGARLALYFLRVAPDVTEPYGILGDKALFEVARTALGLPSGMSNMDIEAQAKILESRINFDDFQDAKKLDKFILRFSTLYDVANFSTESSPILALFGESSGANGILGIV
ncbi:DUF1217 domain-containing protein [Aureimonas flava]|uniref:DUF1217 domain-containing protein n=1 Tax=Aureimonas flava TaxID=2320271 RepID=A0A3A1WMQ8_9HYPH|nr:DUF1217 domain-containing protein [Aureimonas flava]RIY01874.1 DUF1217 domain-containing protein [Aureimonas flava]